MSTFLLGNARVAENSEIMGWAIDPTAPERPVSLILMVDGRETARLNADLPRPDLTDKVPRTDVGFSHTLPDLPQGAECFLFDESNGAGLAPGPQVIPKAPTRRVAPRFTEGELTLEETRHGWFLLNAKDAGVDKTLLDLGEYAEAELAVLAATIDPTHHVIEAGANIGALAIPLAKLLRDDAQLFAVEPQIGVFTRLNAAIALNAADNIVPIWAALGEAQGQLEVPFTDERRHYSSGGVRVDRDSKGQPVPLTTIDHLRVDFCRGKPIGLIKIDVEGAEAAVLEGAENTIQTDRPVIYVETRDRTAYRALRNLVDPLGYMVFWHAADLYQPDNHKGNTTDRYAGQGVNSNVLALPIEKCDRLGGLNDPYLVPTGSQSEFWPPGSFPEKIRPRIEAWQRL